MLAHAYNIITDRGVGVWGHNREIVGGLNATKKMFLSMLIKTVKLPIAVDYDSQIEMHTSTTNTYISLWREFQNNLSDPTWAHGILDQGKGKNSPVKGSGLNVSIMSKTENMCHTYQLRLHVQQLSYQNCHFAVWIENLMEREGKVTMIIYD